MGRKALTNTVYQRKQKPCRRCGGIVFRLRPDGKSNCVECHRKGAQDRYHNRYKNAVQLSAKIRFMIRNGESF